MKFFIRPKGELFKIDDNAYEVSNITIGDFDVYITGQYLRQESFLFFGTGLYNNKRINSTSNFEEILTNPSMLSGRFCLIKFNSDKLEILSSLFGGFPCYYSTCGKYVSSDASTIAKCKGLELSVDFLREKSIYFSEYSQSAYKGIKKLEAASMISIYEHEIKSTSYLKSVFLDREKYEKKQTLEKLYRKIISNAKAYFEESHACVSYTGGRDSRFVLCSLLKVLPKNSVSAFTIGNKDDIEYSVGRRFTKLVGVRHSRIEAEVLTKQAFLKYSSVFGEINFPCLYQEEILRSKNLYNKDVLNTAIPEVLLSHMKYFSGSKHPAENFIFNRKNFLSESNVISGDYIMTSAKESAIKYWEHISKVTPNIVATNIYFEVTTYQRNWVYSILKPYDIIGNTVCLMEDPEILNLLSQLDISDFEGDDLYDLMVSEFCPELNDTPTTRDFDKGIRYVFSKSGAKNLLTFMKFQIWPGSLSKLMKKNELFIKGFIIEHKNNLSDVFTDRYLNELINKLETTPYCDNRISKLKSMIVGRGYFLDYELVLPLCLCGKKIVEKINNTEF
ncbi:hypothetical protein [Vibrio owensii]|uniref:hypothetical protein n=1 Tax=Vibrio owensii TaxID=696485 RepID=UPI0018F150C0|nr:hypothetical protein [Vibrio owensii]